MGAWGASVFESDSALDWVLDLHESASVAKLEDALEIASSGYVEAPDGEAAVVASATLLAFSDQHVVELPEELVQWVSAHRNLDVRPLAAPAVAALGRVLGPESELADLRADSDDSGAEWRAGVTTIRDAFAVAKWAEPSSAPPSVEPAKRPWWKFGA